MDEASAGVYVVTLEALEDGRPPALTILAFVKAETEADAEAVAVVEAGRDGFSDARVLRTAEVIDAAAMPEDFSDAMASAHRYGCGLIVYDEP
ncbi:MAG: hypothetical protein KKE02_23910 [Alphaproteobacteria bacterium]|nr:hypothetical protein [Alphaproteobacteria bacterium]MBU1514902.1 hypothetical protein [Alphaproteobacteria bacterium]MBU2093823.1 hypothetical protein [Alphaproteobacteria bacterium]MBU2154083.1 hypothetical protein [Alphaproteobacteria bacterium]MBU2305404.1 hypothetical protein [Alphaproteobacteria bacterium]